MDYDGGTLSDQPSIGPVTLPENQAEVKRVTSWRILVGVSTVVLICTLLIGGGIYLSLTKRHFRFLGGNVSEPSGFTTPASFNEEPTANVTPAAGLEIPLLFPGLTVKQRQEGILFKTEDPDGPAQILGMRVEANIKSPQDVQLAYELVTYYHEYFSKYNWENYLAGDRPGNSINGWKKDGRYFIIEIQVDIKSGTTSALLLYN